MKGIMMVDIQVVYDKLCGFETADELADYFMGLGIKGNQSDGISCAVTKYVMLETGLNTIRTNTQELIMYEANGEGNILFQESHTDAVVEFIHGFDHSKYPNLVEKNGWY